MPQTEEELLANWRELGPNARRLLTAFSARLVKGHRLYGDFPARRWTREAVEEGLDQCVYLTAELLYGSLESEKDDPAKR